jgi:hypothetical protein
VISSAPSGAGKEAGRRAIKNMLSESGLSWILGGERISSDSAIISRLKNQPTILYPWDEVGEILAAQSSSASPHLMQIAPTLMSLFSSSSSIWTGVDYATTDRSVACITNPHINIYGTTTPNSIARAFSVDDAERGLIGRILFFRSYDEPNPQKTQVVNKEELADVYHRLRQMAQNKPTTEKERQDDPFHFANQKPTLEVIANQSLTEFLFEKAVYFTEAARRQPSESLKSVISRGYEFMIKICIGFSAFSNPLEPSLSMEVAEYAFALTDYLMKDSILLAEKHLQNTNHDKTCETVLQIVQAAGKNGIGFAAIKKSVKGVGKNNSSKDLREVMETLVDQDLVTETLLGENGKLVKIYKDWNIETFSTLDSQGQTNNKIN